jgi:hypothetical protein
MSVGIDSAFTRVMSVAFDASAFTRNRADIQVEL